MVLLSQRELVVCCMRTAGASDKQIANILGISTWTAGSYIRRARAKFLAAGIDAGTTVLLLNALEQEPRVWRVPGRRERYRARDRRAYARKRTAA